AGESGVFVIADSAAVANYIPVRIGIVTSEKTEIIFPEINGIVVTLGQHLLEDGSPVILPGKNLEKPMRKGKKE
ncbi:hypothetical protein L0Z72_13450, partial [candidate division KSB1 bacterium]|nr:hypothetical protein [candidate division KSB1 bacterium]